MTEKEIQEQLQKQINALRIATSNATKSKKAANNYLTDAGIIPKKKETKFDKKRNNR
jgi:hypothetical protein